MTRQANLITADEVMFSVSGKLNVLGIYATDINIPTDPMVATQLVFLFLIETDTDDPYQKLELRVELPGGDSRQTPLNISGFRGGQADKVRWSLKYPFLFQNPILRPGPIVATVIHDKGIMLPAAPFVVLRAPILTVAPTKQ
jgi:hypothetical protein